MGDERKGQCCVGDCRRPICFEVTEYCNLEDVPASLCAGCAENLEQTGCLDWYDEVCSEETPGTYFVCARCTKSYVCCAQFEIKRLPLKRRRAFRRLAG